MSGCWEVGDCLLEKIQEDNKVMRCDGDEV